MYESIKENEAEVERLIDYISRDHQVKTEQEVDSQQVVLVEKCSPNS